MDEERSRGKGGEEREKKYDGEKRKGEKWGRK